MNKPVFVNNEVARLLGPSLGRQGSFQSYSGIDISCYVYFPDITKSSLTRDSRKKTKLFAELQTLSISSTRSISPVRVLGRSSPLAYTRGARSFAGTMVFASVNQDVFADIYDESIAESTLYSSSSMVADQLPPFSIVITAANEKGGAAIQVVHGITIVNYGTTYSIDDLYTEVTYCVDQETEALTSSGWKKYNKILPSDKILTINPETKQIEWQTHTRLNIFDYEGEMHHWNNYRGVDALTTPNHRWLEVPYGQYIKNGINGCALTFNTSENLSNKNKFVLYGGGNSSCFSKEKKYSNELVELVGWAVTEGQVCYSEAGTDYGICISQSINHNPDWVDRLKSLVSYFSTHGTSSWRVKDQKSGDHSFYFGKGIWNQIKPLMGFKCFTADFILNLTEDQARLLLDTLIRADGTTNKVSGHKSFIQNPTKLNDMVQMLCSMLGTRTKVYNRKGSVCKTLSLYESDIVSCKSFSTKVQYKGIVWCPTTPNGTWLARRNKGTFWTGNSYVATDVLPLSSTSISLTREIKGVPSTAGQTTISDLVQKEMGRAYGTQEEKLRAAKARILKSTQDTNGLYESP